MLGSKPEVFIRKVEPVYRLERTEVQQCGSVERHESGDVECINVIEEYNERTNEHANEFHRYVHVVIQSIKNLCVIFWLWAGAPFPSSRTSQLF